MRAIGFAGWSGAGKTTLIVKLIAELNRRGFSVSTLKHAHHGFDVDSPGKDSYAHRSAGAHEVLVASDIRLALMREFRGASPPPLRDLLRLLDPVDFLLIEGFKRDPIPKIEVFRKANDKPPLHLEDESIVAIAGDDPVQMAGLPRAWINDAITVADFVETYAAPIEAILERLAQA
jgi:molybdopterin-guanine dinucleotide biosynthesis protein B